MIAIQIMDSKTSYYPLDIRDDLPKPKMTRILRYLPQSQDTKQAIKKRFKAFHRISFESQNISKPLSPSEVRNLTKLLKRLKYLPSLGIALDSIPSKEKVLARFFEALKHTKSFSQIHFSFTNPSMYYTKELLLISQKTLRSVCALPRKNIKLSFHYSHYCLNNFELKILKNFIKQKAFTSANLLCHFGSRISKIQEIITILSNSKSLSEFSLTLNKVGSPADNPDRSPDDIFHTLTKLKTVKKCRIYFKGGAESDSKLKELVPAIKEVAQVFNLEIIIQGYGNFSSVTRLEWWLFKRSLRNLSPSHTVHAEFIGELDPYSAKEWLVCCSILFFSPLLIMICPTH